jgi:hypothetical protein
MLWITWTCCWFLVIGITQYLGALTDRTLGRKPTPLEEHLWYWPLVVLWIIGMIKFW